MTESEFEIRSRTLGDYVVLRIGERTYGITGPILAALRNTHFRDVEPDGSGQLQDITPWAKLDYQVSTEFSKQDDGNFIARAYPSLSGAAEWLEISEDVARELAQQS